MLTHAPIAAAFEALRAPHADGIKPGFEIHDRQVFITRFLSVLGYGESNVLVDVSQNSGGSTYIPDIRVYGNNEVRNREAHAQLVFETKNFGMFSGDPDAVDLKQIKKYIIANRSRIRVIVATDFVHVIAFNATEIKTASGFRIDRPDALSEPERDAFRAHRLFVVRLDQITPETLKCLNLLSHDIVFGVQKFRNPNEFRDTSNIADGEVRRSFIIQLFHTMRRAEDQLRSTFKNITHECLATLAGCSTTHEVSERLETALRSPAGPLVKAFILWGIEMNYLPPFLSDPNSLESPTVLTAFVRHPQYPDAFVLSSAYSLVNKSFFLRTLEDTQTERTPFVRGEIAGRYLSDGILEARYAEGVPSLVTYLKDLFSFQREDLARYGFLLRRDTFSWVLGHLDPQLLVDIVRLFNDVHLGKLNQDILGDIYEHYLEQDRPEGEDSYRKLLGQYYTPKPIVRLMWRLTREVLKSTKNRDIYDKNAPALRVLDPCYGSGTFLCEGVLQINACASGKTIDKDGRVFGFIADRTPSRRMEDSLTGFELNPLSKSIADVNLFFSLIQAYGPTHLVSTPIQRLRLFRTNSLDVGKATTRGRPAAPLFAFAEEVQQADRDNQAISDAKNSKYDIVIANPPYAYTDRAKDLTEQLLPFAMPVFNFDGAGNPVPFKFENQRRRGRIPPEEQNRGKLRDLYSYFFAAADRLVADGGIVTYITSNTWLAIPTYKFFRKYFLENYTIHFLLNFNNISERTSMFAPDAGIATAIVVMSKGAPPEGHAVRYCDLSEVSQVKDKFDAIAKVKWKGREVDRRDIASFELRSLSELEWSEVPQTTFLNKPDHIIRFSKSHEDIITKLETDTARLSSQLHDYQGVIPGDMSVVVAETRAELRARIEGRVFTGQLTGVKTTAARHIRAGLATGRIDRRYDASKETPFVYQKDFERYSIARHSWIYMDHHVLWRSRLMRGRAPATEILDPNKLFVLERREQSKLLALVTKDIVVPQQGGRFFYFVPREERTTDDLHCFCAIVNSAPINFYYRVASQGNKDVRVRTLEKIPAAARAELVHLSRKLHGLYRDRARVVAGQSEFETAELVALSSQQGEALTLLSDCELWDVSIHGSISADCYVVGVHREPTEPIIQLNSRVFLSCKTVVVADTLMRCLAGYEGDLLQSPPVLRRSDFGLGDGPDMLTAVDREIATATAAVNNAVARLYDLTPNQVERINAVLETEVLAPQDGDTEEGSDEEDE